MDRPIRVFVLAALVVASTFSAPLLGAEASQPPKAATLIQEGRYSPHDTISKNIDGNRLTIVYGRPYTNDPITHKARSVWGGELVPYNKIWRLGADEATLMITQCPIDLGAVRVPAGAYSLWMLLESNGTAKLIVNREIGQWGLNPPRQDRELARIPMQKSPLSSPVHQFTIGLENGNGTEGVIRMMWENTQYSIVYRVAK